MQVEYDKVDVWVEKTWDKMQCCIVSSHMYLSDLSEYWNDNTNHLYLIIVAKCLPANVFEHFFHYWYLYEFKCLFV